MILCNILNWQSLVDVILGRRPTRSIQRLSLLHAKCLTSYETCIVCGGSRPPLVQGVLGRRRLLKKRTTCLSGLAALHGILTLIRCDLTFTSSCPTIAMARLRHVSRVYWVGGSRRGRRLSEKSVLHQTRSIGGMFQRGLGRLVGNSTSLCVRRRCKPRILLLDLLLLLLLRHLLGPPLERLRSIHHGNLALRCGHCLI